MLIYLCDVFQRNIGRQGGCDVADPDNKVEVGLAGGVTFANGSTTGSIGFSSAKSDIGSKQETKDTALMVNASSFVEPGIYRYVIKETSTSGFEGIAYSTEKKILDIYKYSDDSFDYRFFDEATGDKLSEANFTNTYNHAEGQVQDRTGSGWPRLDGRLRFHCRHWPASRRSIVRKTGV